MNNKRNGKRHELIWRNGIYGRIDGEYLTVIKAKWLTIQIDGMLIVALIRSIINANKKDYIDSRKLFLTIVRIYLTKIFLRKMRFSDDNHGIQTGNCLKILCFTAFSNVLH